MLQTFLSSPAAAPALRRGLRAATRPTADERRAAAAARGIEKTTTVCCHGARRRQGRLRRRWWRDLRPRRLIGACREGELT
jgi:hypothetical protein